MHLAAAVPLERGRIWVAWLGNGMHPENSASEPEAKGGGTAACSAVCPTLSLSLPGAGDIRESLLRVLHKGLSNATQRGLRSLNSHASAKGKILPSLLSTG